MKEVRKVEELARTIAEHVGEMSPEESLRYLFRLDDLLYKLQGRESIRYGGGVHTKHRHTRYHDFFVDRVEPMSLVLDFGCGNGALTYDIATKAAPAQVFGIDLEQSNISIALSRFAHPKIEYVMGDALIDLPDRSFDCIVMSNVLEHLEDRVGTLSGLSNRFKPKKILIRVPLFERDWRVPLKKELGLEWRLDDTHFTEYTVDEFLKEIDNSGLFVFHYEIHWGEIWADVRGK